MQKGILYGVGVGPGDPELLTVKAVRVLREVAAVAVPDTGRGDKAALTIAQSYIEGKELILCPSPMSRDRRAADASYDETARLLAERLERGENLAFITLGDPSVYSTYCYVQKRVAAMGYETRTVPGITSFCAAAARLGESLCEGAEPLVIVPASSMEPEAWINLPGNKVLMKAGGKMPALTSALARLDADISAVSNCGMDGEQVSRGVDALDATAGYFSVIIVKERH
ncbi:MAG: precorrin-2 C(20)-methyltransferase [Oscillospiraceae bacterium]|jgi:precorrin-2/cobalt-factor-2 C20-methyltransferase|nr:precorrin-2 C(20)-methyltransferase [Oscillospiraceae bacterium]